MAGAGLSRTELARRMGRSQPSVSRSLRAGWNLTLRSVAEIALAAGVRVRLSLVPLDAPEGCASMANATLQGVFATLSADEARALYQVLAERAEDERIEADDAASDAKATGRASAPHRADLLCAVVARLDAATAASEGLT